jgi:hypothetical protein
MEIYKEVPACLRHKIIQYLRNPEADIVWPRICRETSEQFTRVLVTLNRYNYFRKYRKPHWDRLVDDKGKIILFDFYIFQPPLIPLGYIKSRKETYLDFLEKRELCGRHERGTKLRVDLFNELNKTYERFNGQIIYPPTHLYNTSYHALDDKKCIETQFNIRIPDDEGHPSISFEEWRHHCWLNGSLPHYCRRKVRAPRNLIGKWNSIKGQKNCLVNKMKYKRRIVSHICEYRVKNKLIPYTWLEWVN